MSPVSNAKLEEVALSQEEYNRIVDIIGREPNELELGMFGALWSEHCGYKYSKRLLKLLPSNGTHVLSQIGQDNAGAVDIGGGLAVVFKVESHNHPSAIEPFQGAATGVGGIVRDILAMGARPIALLNSLRFGPLCEARNRYLFNNVISGISWYGNCIGVPDVGGEIAFSKSYSGNPLVNALCVGIVEKRHLTTSTVDSESNILILVGSGTGRDGIHGASGLASRTFEVEQEMRPTVQVGDPFLEKILIEACLEASSVDGLVGIQDLGAAGLTSSTVEAANRGGYGIHIDISKVHQRERGMNAYEVMLSESQERMLLITNPSGMGRLAQVLDKWDIPWSEIGRVERGNRARVFDGEKQQADLPVQDLANPTLYKLKGRMSNEVKKARKFPMASLDLPREDPDVVLIDLLKSPNIASKECVYRQYDYQVQTNTVIVPGVADAALLRVKGTGKGIALSTDGNGRFCYLDPHIGGMIAVAESCRNVSCVGATPIALTDCLNFGNPERPEIYYQLERCIEGIAKACNVLGVPIVSGNVSLYNETRGTTINPTPVIGALGLLDDVTKHVVTGFKNEGDMVVLIGPFEAEGRVDDLAGSEYLERYHNLLVGTPYIDLTLETKVQALCRLAISKGMINSAHDCSDGGLAVAVAEASLLGGLGFKGSFSVTGRWDAVLFGEAQSRIIVSIPPDSLPAFQSLGLDLGVPMTVIGRVEGTDVRMSDLIQLSLEDMNKAWRYGLQDELLGEWD